jgi:hypothetical protein
MVMARQKGSRKKIFKGELEIDHERGVIYFHLTGKRDIKTTETISLLRICRLPKIPFPLRDILDITHMFGCNWNKLTEERSMAFEQKQAIPLGPSTLHEPQVSKLNTDQLTEAIKRKVRMR